MPPILMLIGVVFVVLLVMFGNNPLDKMREEANKYGKDPLAREINKFNEENSKKGSTVRAYKPPPGAMTYRVPANEAQLPTRKPSELGTGEDNLVRPAPELPVDQWDSPYPQYMITPGNTGNTGFIPEGTGDGRSLQRNSGTSLVPGSKQ